MIKKPTINQNTTIILAILLLTMNLIWRILKVLFIFTKEHAQTNEGKPKIKNHTTPKNVKTKPVKAKPAVEVSKSDSIENVPEKIDRKQRKALKKQALDRLINKG